MQPAPKPTALKTKIKIGIAALCAVCAGLGLWPAASSAADSATVLMYHRFGDDRYPSTNIRLEQFEAHLEELTTGGYHVLPLTEIVDALKTGADLPERAVAITVDDAYISVYRDAWPRLKAAGLPFTLFVSTGRVDSGDAEYMTWDHLRELAAEGVTIGNHTVSHLHMIGQGAEKNRREIEGAQQRFQRELGHRPTLFAYPYGEFGAAEAALVERMGFAAAFGQYSSVANRSSHMFLLPRFALNENYGDIGRFRLVASALPIPARDIVPVDPVITTNPPAFGFTLMQEVEGIAALACYPSHLGEAATLEILGEERVEVRFAKPLPKGRNRINCTMPGPDGRWRWLGYPFFVQ